MNAHGAPSSFVAAYELVPVCLSLVLQKLKTPLLNKSRPQLNLPQPSYKFVMMILLHQVCVAYILIPQHHGDWNAARQRCSSPHQRCVPFARPPVAGGAQLPIAETNLLSLKPQKPPSRLESHSVQAYRPCSYS
jgi:hypothetical protein